MTHRNQSYDTPSPSGGSTPGLPTVDLHAVGIRARFAILLVSLLAAAAMFAAPARAQSGGGTDPTYEQRLIDQFQTKAKSATEAYQAADWTKAAREYEEAALAGEQLANLGSGRVDPVRVTSTPYYNAACSASLGGDTANGYRLLAAAIRFGFDDLELLEGDTDLDPLREDDAAFDEVVGVLRRQQAQWMDGFAAGRVFIPRELRSDTSVDDATNSRQPVGAIVFLHGSGGNVEGVAPFAEAVMSKTGVPVILIRGPIAFERGQFRWRQGQPAAEVALIDEWVERARKDVPQLDPARVVISGFSQGGGQALLLGLDSPRPFAGAIPMGPYVQVAQRYRLTADVYPSTRIGVIAGENEEAAIIEAAATVERLNGHSGLETRRKTIPGIGHELPMYLAEEVARMYAWIQEGYDARNAAE